MLTPTAEVAVPIGSPGNFVSLANERHPPAREEPLRVSWTRRWGEDGVGSDPPPDDMRLAGCALFAVAEGRPAIVIPSHLEHARMSSHPLDAQAWPERPVRSRQVRDECLGDHLAEHGLLLPREVLPVPLETRKRLKRRH